MKKSPQWYFWTSSAGIFLITILYFAIVLTDLPSIHSLSNYKPPLISFVYDKNEEIIGEFFRQRRIVIPFDEFPPHLIQAFIAAEDSQFYTHKGLDYRSILRAFLANLKSGRKVQGGSTITQQVAKSLLLSSERTYTRKLKEAVLATRMEQKLSKEHILYLYLNQIYFGHGAYGVGMATHIYFNKEVSELTLEESAILAGLPQAPSKFSPIINSKKAKQRQVYVLNRMLAEKYISQEQYEETIKKPVTVFARKNYAIKAPFVTETVRQLLIDEVGEKTLLESGLNIHTSIDYSLQKEAQKQLKIGLQELDKRQGYRGVIQNITLTEASEFLSKREKKWIRKNKDQIIMDENGEDTLGTLRFSHIRPGDELQGVVTKVEDKLVYVDLIFGNKGVIPLQTTRWAKTPEEKKKRYTFVESMSEILKTGDVIWVEIKNLRRNRRLVKRLEEDYSEELFARHLLLELEQQPIVQGALLSLDQKTEDILSLVGGYNFEKSQFNRTYQARRQPGSIFKPFIYGAALDKGFTPSSVISDEPVVFDTEEADLLLKNKAEEEGEEEFLESLEEVKKEKWKPSNYSKTFKGDILFKNALIQSLNIPTVKLVEHIGIPWIEFYIRRLGVTSKLNLDYTLALGSSSVTLYEMTKAFSIFGRQGRRIFPKLINVVEDSEGNLIARDISLDNKFKELLTLFKEEFEKSWAEYWNNKEAEALEKAEEESLNENLEEIASKEDVNVEVVETKKEKVEKKSTIFFEDINQVISPQSAYLITSILKGVIFESTGTGRRARILKRPMAGKTGSTDGYYDAWFVGYSPQITTGVWVGFDNEKTLGHSETGSRAALPIWIQYMKFAHKDLEVSDFEVPESIVFANIDNKTGHLAGVNTKEVIRQAFIEGTEPKKQEEEVKQEEAFDDQIFLRKDLGL